MEGRVESRIKLKISSSDTMSNYQISQKIKLLGSGEFNHNSNSTLSNAMDNIFQPTVKLISSY